MKKSTQIYILFLMFVFCTSCGEQNKPEIPKENIKPVNKEIITTYGPKTITRNIIQDRKGNIWIAAFDGIFRYDGKSFANITSKETSARFFSVLEDRKGNFWFATIGSGVYYYDGKSFQNYTTSKGLLNNEVTSIYEDKKGNIWFGVLGGASCYDGKSFRNYIIDGNAMNEDLTGKIFPDRPLYEVNSIIEDTRGRFWFATRGNTFVYDGQTFKAFSHNGKPFTNVGSVIEDKKGNILLGGNDGLWRYDGSTFTNFTQNAINYVHEDGNGNIWTASNTALGWVLSRYDEKTLSNKNPTASEIHSKEGRMFFGFFVDKEGSIWFGAADGVYRYDGNTITDFRNNRTHAFLHINAIRGL